MINEQSQGFGMSDFGDGDIEFIMSEMQSINRDIILYHDHIDKLKEESNKSVTNQKKIDGYLQDINDFEDKIKELRKQLNYKQGLLGGQISG